MNASEAGYVKLYRSIFEGELWNEERPKTKLEAWIDLIASARFEATPAKRLIGYKTVTWNRGQFPASYRFLADRWGWSTKKVGKFLDLLKNEKMITVEASKETGQSLITVCNYELYNHTSDKEETGEKRRGNRRETQGKQEGNAGVDKTKKDKNGKNVEEGKEEYPPMPPYSDFENYAFDKAVELNIEVDPSKLRAKYEAWKENGWRTGKNAKIKNWKTTLLNTLNYLTKEKSSAKKEKERGLEAALSFANVKYNG